MKILKWTLAVIVSLGVVLWVVGMLLSPRFVVTRSITINAPAEKVYGLVADPRGWTRWSVWNRRDAAMQITYSGPPSGAGARWEWKSKSEGDGVMTFTAAEPPRRVAFDLFFPDFGTTSKGELRFEPQGSGTQVTWVMNGDMGRNPLFHWFALFAEGMVGKDFEGGLANLKAVAEKG